MRESQRCDDFELDAASAQQCEARHDPNFEDGVVVHEAAVMRARDGTRLVMDIYFPAHQGIKAAGRFPVLLERTPYNRKLPRFVEFGRAAAQRGYVFIVQDVRGRFGSSGHFHMMTNIPTEGDDGWDTVEWIKQQDWYDGRLGTVGGSFSAANQQALALLKPYGLRAQVLRDGGNNYYQRMFRYHGAYNLGVTLAWALDHGSQGHEAMADPSIAEALKEMGRSLDKWLGSKPLRRGQTPLSLAPAYEDVFFSMMEKTDDEPYWHNPTVRLEGRWDEYPKDVAILLISGWFAHHANANLEKLNELGKRSQRSVQLLMGPWVHHPGMGEITVAGEAEFGIEAARFGPVTKLWLDWLDRQMGPSPVADAREETALRYFLMGTGDGHRTEQGRIFHGGEWHSSKVWPPTHVKPVAWYLQPDKGLTTRLPSETNAYSTYEFDPEHPFPTIGATSQQSENYPAFILPGPRDQVCRPDFFACRGQSGPLSERTDVLVFQTAALDQPIEVTGPLSVRLWVSSSAADTDFTARLIDVYPPSDQWPEGYALLLSEGILRMRYRDRQAKGELIEPGKIYEIEIEINPTSNLFKTGHRIRLDISSSSFPGYDINPNTGEPLGRHTHTVPATQTIFHDHARPSQIVLFQSIHQ